MINLPPEIHCSLLGSNFHKERKCRTMSVCILVSVFVSFRKKVGSYPKIVSLSTLVACNTMN